MSFKTFSVRMLITVVFILLSTFVNFGTPCCEQKERISILLDTAMDLISRVKAENISCPVEHNITIGTPQDCTDLYRRGYNKSGVYAIRPVNRLTSMKSLYVYCDMNDGGWTVIQRRGVFGRSDEYFNQNWETYKKGFGHIERDFWLGNDYIFALTNQRQYSVYFALEDKQHNKFYAHYDSFWIDDESNKYTLHISGYSGTTGDSMETHNNMKFTTKDQDNEMLYRNRCGEIHKSGWWFRNCADANLNGRYTKNAARGIFWGLKLNLLQTEIKIKPSIY